MREQGGVVFIVCDEGDGRKEKDDEENVTSSSRHNSEFRHSFLFDLMHANLRLLRDQLQDILNSGYTPSIPNPPIIDVSAAEDDPDEAPWHTTVIPGLSQLKEDGVRRDFEVLDEVRSHIFD